MTVRTKSEQKAYLDGFEMCAECIEKYLSNEGKKKLECLLISVRNAVEDDDLYSNEKIYKELINTQELLFKILPIIYDIQTYTKSIDEQIGKENK